ncbi:MAG: substrate-binding domain-containing protein, partial [Spirochaetales bacterium]|nr:substrate-binding domain-containing protein [Spirochaetales bacterium]
DKYGLPVDMDLIKLWDSNKGFASPPEEILKMKNPPTAYFTMHLNITVEMMKLFESAGKRIPDDLSIIGFHAIPTVELWKVPVTVIRQSPYDIGSESAKLLLETISSKSKKTKRIVLPCTFIERNSCGPPPS